MLGYLSSKMGWIGITEAAGGWVTGSDRLPLYSAGGNLLDLVVIVHFVTVPVSFFHVVFSALAGFVQSSLLI